MLALPGVNSDAVGSATLRVSADGTQAILNFSVNNLTGSAHRRSHQFRSVFEPIRASCCSTFPPRNRRPTAVIFWKIKADRLAVGRRHSRNHQRRQSLHRHPKHGQFRTAKSAAISRWPAGSQTFTPPPAPPAWTDDSANANAAVRFLTQATFGASSSDIASVQSLGYSQLDQQSVFACRPRIICRYVLANPDSDPTDPVSKHVLVQYLVAAFRDGARTSCASASRSR